MKVLINVDQKTTSADLVDQLVMSRLAAIRDEIREWADNPEIATACQTLLDWMAEPTGE
jgi:hypothetical protein